jgi:heme/copper-type cytochrome/quinol oxidase subunit 3
MDNKLMIKLVVGTEAVFFLCLIVSFIYLAYVSGYEPAHYNALNLTSTGIFSILLFSSSGTFYLSERSYKKGNLKSWKTWLLLTIILGLIFLIGQGREYTHLITEEKMTLSSSLFGTSFYTLTGFHGFHVLVGLIVLSIILCLGWAGDFKNGKSSVIPTVGIYWHFVDIVWVFVFTVVYILPKTGVLK